MNNSTFGIHFVLKMNMIINGLAPIYTRITVDSKRCEISVKRKILSDNWDFGKGMAKLTNKSLKLLKNCLVAVRLVGENACHNYSFKN